MAERRDKQGLTRATPGKWLPWLFLLLLTHAVLTLPVALLIDSPTDYSFDEQEWHYPNVLLLAEKWPALDWMDHHLQSGSAPGYHYFLAGMTQITGSNIHTLRVINVFVSIALLVVLFMACVRRLDPGLACMLLMPLATSNYFIKTSAFLFTDNAGLLLATAALLLAAREKLTSLNSVMAGVFAACATLARQLHFWVAGPLLWRAMEPLLTPLSVRFFPGKYHQAGNDKQGSAGKSIFQAVLMLALPVAVLLFFYAQWGGLIPQPWRAEVMAVSTAAWAYQLALIAVFAPFYLLPVAGVHKLLLEKSTRLAMLAGATFGLVTALAFANSFSEAAGHYGGVLWRVAEKLPVLYERSPLFLLLSPLGGALLALTCCWLHAQRGFMVSMRWLVWVCAWASTSLIQKLIFQRYFEAPLLLLFALALALGLDENKHRRLAVSLCALVMIQLALTVAGFYANLPW